MYKYVFPIKFSSQNIIFLSQIHIFLQRTLHCHLSYNVIIEMYT